MERKKLVDPHFVKKQLREYLDKGFLWWKKGRKLTHKGEKYLNLIGVEKLAAGLNNLTYSFTIEYRTKQKDIGNRDYILRIVDYRNVHKVENEVDRMSQAEELDIPMPDLYIYEDKSDFLQGPFIIMEKIEGLPVMEVIHTFTHKQTKKFLSDLAHALGVLHNVRIDKWDSYYLNKKHLRERLGRRHDFSDYIMHEIKQILRRFKKLQLDKHHNLDIQYLYKWFKGHSPLLGIEVYSLVHGDVRPSNIIVDGIQNNNNNDLELTGLIDWEMSCFSDPAQDLGWTLFFFKLYENLRKHRGFFFQEYWKYSKKLNIEARVNFYESVAAIKLYTYAISTRKNKPHKFEKNKEFFGRVIKEVPKYLDRITHRD